MLPQHSTSFAVSSRLLAGYRAFQPKPSYTSQLRTWYIDRISGWYQYCRANIKTSYACRSLNATPRKIFLSARQWVYFLWGVDLHHAWRCLLREPEQAPWLPTGDGVIAPYPSVLLSVYLFRHPKNAARAYCLYGANGPSPIQRCRFLKQRFYWSG